MTGGSAFAVATGAVAQAEEQTSGTKSRCFQERMGAQSVTCSRAAPHRCAASRRAWARALPGSRGAWGHGAGADLAQLVEMLSDEARGIQQGIHGPDAHQARGQRDFMSD